MSPPRELTEEESSRLISELPSAQSNLVVFLLNTGLRLGEALALRAADISLSPPFAEIRGETTKTGVGRRVPLNRAAAQAAGRALVNRTRYQLRHTPPELLWVVWKGRHHMAYLDPIRAVPISPRALQAILGRAARRAGIVGRVSPHILRHTFASRLAREGVNVRVIQTLLGHSRLSSTQRYTHVRPDELEEAVRRLV